VRLSPHTSLDSTPFPSTPPGLSTSGVVGASGGGGSQAAPAAGGAMDPNRAFQAINAETLEQASQDVDYPLPPQGVRWLLNVTFQRKTHTVVIVFCGCMLCHLPCCQGHAGALEDTAMQRR
jgi:hypothetical protein